jgi:hypothetical protein
MDDVGIFVGIWSTLRPFGIFCGQMVIFYDHLLYFSRFGMLYQSIIWQPRYVDCLIVDLS